MTSRRRPTQTESMDYANFEDRKLGRRVDRTHRELTDDEVSRIANTYHAWRCSFSTSSLLTSTKNSSPSPSTGEGKGEGDISGYKDITGFCRSATLDNIRKHGHILTPGRYVGAEAQEDASEAFEEKMKRLTTMLRQQQAEAANLDATITANLKELGYGG